MQCKLMEFTLNAPHRRLCSVTGELSVVSGTFALTENSAKAQRVPL